MDKIVTFPRPFKEKLAMGQAGESKIARYLRRKGNSVLPVYEKEIDTGKGPMLFIPDGSLVAPDMLVIPQGARIEWVEAKHKSVFSWYRKGEYWCTGIDIHHFEQYQQVQNVSDRRIWLYFLHERSTPSAADLAHGCPAECPTGLFAGSLAYLSRNESHRSPNHGKGGMVYWAFSVLQVVEYLEDMEAEQ